MPDFSIEKKFDQNVVGIDEVGRGTLAGPVVSCAFIFYEKYLDKESLNLIHDSKKLSLKRRLNAYKKINELKKLKKINYKLGIASVQEIDNVNILEATKISMIRAVKKLKLPPTPLIIDGNIDLKLKDYPSNSIIQGDNKSLTIAAASILAKIHRDRYMQFLSNYFPIYNWSKNVGYGTKKHLEQIYKKGFTKHHRKSFQPIKSLIHNK